MSEGFLGRWSKRKLDVKQARTLAEPQPSRPSRESAAASQTAVEVPTEGPVAPTAAAEECTPNRAAPPPPTLADVDALTAESDYARFAAPDVAPEVRNAAMKKLFADPRYNVMDGLDVYTGDYSRPDPISAATLRQLASAAFLGLAREEEEARDPSAQARDVADNPTAQSVAKSSAGAQAVPAPDDHADPDLRLQQDHAAPGKDPGRGSG
jgi:hypothetical protein